MPIPESITSTRTPSAPSGRKARVVEPILDQRQQVPAAGHDLIDAVALGLV
jgi:hypothetical protein